jgi:hypothetical protein
VWLVAERPGHQSGTAVTLGLAVSGFTAGRANRADRDVDNSRLRPMPCCDAPLTADDDIPTSPAGAQRYLAAGFEDHPVEMYGKNEFAG